MVSLRGAALSALAVGFKSIYDPVVCPGPGPVIAPAVDQWAILVAGGSGVTAYHHQADVCRAYNLLQSGGIPADHIITMSPADSTEYSLGQALPKTHDCYIDYIAATPETFIQVLTGNATDDVPTVLGGGSNSTLFVYYSGTGAAGSLYFPAGPFDGALLYSDQMTAALRESYSRGLYGSALMFISATQSDMFLTNPPPHTFVMTSGIGESWATQCHGSFGVCLATRFGSDWMNEMEFGIGTSQNVYQLAGTLQLSAIVEVTAAGDRSIGEAPMFKFIGTPASSPAMCPVPHSFTMSEDDTREFGLHWLARLHEGCENTANLLYVLTKAVDNLVKFAFDGLKEQFPSADAAALDVTHWTCQEWDTYRAMVGEVTKHMQLDISLMRHLDFIPRAINSGINASAFSAALVV